MQRILQSFKNLFLGDDILRKHLYLCLLLLLPSVSISFVSLLDKETPKEYVFILLAFALFFLVLSIVPVIFSLGLYLDFCKLRLNNEEGFPMVSSSMFNRGLKYLPLGIVWNLYFLMIFGVLVAIPIVGIIFAITAKDVASIVVSLIIFLVFGFLAMVLLMIIPPFFRFIEFNFAKDLEYKFEYFNPLTLVQYIKKSFVPTVLVMLKFVLVNFVTSSISSIISAIWALFYMGFVFIIALLNPDASEDKFYYSPGMIIFSVIMLLFPVLLQMYVSIITSFAATENYIDVYKKDIETLENKENVDNV